MRSRGFGTLAPFDTSVALSREPRACHARHLPASAFRTLSPACTPQHRPGLFHPGNAPEVSPSGLRTSPGSRAPSRAACSHAVSFAPAAAERRRRSSASELRSPRRVRTATVRKPGAAAALLAFKPLQGSPSLRRGPGSVIARARAVRPLVPS